MPDLSERGEGGREDVSGLRRTMDSANVSVDDESPGLRGACSPARFSLLERRYLAGVHRSVSRRFAQSKIAISVQLADFSFVPSNARVGFNGEVTREFGAVIVWTGQNVVTSTLKRTSVFQPQNGPQNNEQVQAKPSIIPGNLYTSILWAVYFLPLITSKRASE